MVIVQAKQPSIYQGKAIHQCCQGCSINIASTEIVATDKYNQKFHLALCGSCTVQLKEGLKNA